MKAVFKIQRLKESSPKDRSDRKNKQRAGEVDRWNGTKKNQSTFS